MATVVQSGTVTRLEGLPVDPKPPGAIGALSLALELLGHRMLDEDLLGFSGAAFRLQLMQPDWEAVAMQATIGYDVLREASRSVGFAVQPVPLERRFPYVRHEIDNGRPLIVEREEAGLVVGYEEAERVAHVLNPSTRVVVCEQVDDWTWDRLYTLLPNPANRQPIEIRLRRALELAVSLLHGDDVRDKDTDFFWIACGYNAYEAWCWELSQEDRFDCQDSPTREQARLVNQATYHGLIVSRTAAGHFLQKHQDLLGRSSVRHLAIAANLFGQAAEALTRSLDCLPSTAAHEADRAWTQTMRRGQIDALRESERLDRLAEEEIRSALGASRTLFGN